MAETETIIQGERVELPPLTHLTNWRVSPDVAYCGERRNGRPYKIGAEVTCVVCREFQRDHNG